MTVVMAVTCSDNRGGASPHCISMTVSLNIVNTYAGADGYYF